MRWFLRLAYRGAPFHGWQVQPGMITVQGVLEQALGVLLRRPVAIIGAGRTDTGVNARTMIAHFDTTPDERRPDDPTFLRSLNSLTGPDIAVYEAREVHDDAHARFDATERTYRYFVHTVKDPFASGLSLQLPSSIDFEAMNRAGELITGRRDFTSFSKLHTDVKTNICDLRTAVWHATDASHFYFEITADRFLRNMVRAVVGTLLEVGRHKMAPGGILDVLGQMDRCAAGTSMPGGPLFLWDIRYPY